MELRSTPQSPSKRNFLRIFIIIAIIFLIIFFEGFAIPYTKKNEKRYLTEKDIKYTVLYTRIYLYSILVSYLLLYYYIVFRNKFYWKLGIISSLVCTIGLVLLITYKHEKGNLDSSLYRNNSYDWIIDDTGIKKVETQTSGTETYIANIELQKKGKCADTYNVGFEIDGQKIETGYDVNGTFCVDYVNKKLDKPDEDGNEYDKNKNVVDKVGLIYDRENIKIIDPHYNPVSIQEKCQGPKYPCIFMHETNSEGSKLITNYKNNEGKELTEVLISDIWDEKIDINNSEIVSKISGMKFGARTGTVYYTENSDKEKIYTPVLMIDLPPNESNYNHGLQLLLILLVMKRYGVARPSSISLKFSSNYK